MRGANQDIRRIIIQHGLFNYQVAQRMGIDADKLEDMLSRPLTDAQRTQIETALLFYDGGNNHDYQYTGLARQADTD